MFGNVAAPPAAPPVAAGYCTTINTELAGYLDRFNQTLGNPAPYATLQIAQLQSADSNAGPSISNPGYLANVMVQVQELQAMGFQGVKVEVAFPVLYQPYFGSQAAMQPYLDFYTNLAQNLKSMHMKLVVENNVSLSTGTEVGWSNLGSYYNTLNWSQFIAARATMAATVAQYMQPDFLMLSEEPDNEAVNAGQPNLNTPSYAAAMIAGEIAAARAVSPSIKLGAGFGTWLGPYSPSGLLDYMNAYLALPMDFLDMHIYAINTEYGGISNLLNNALIVAQGAAAVSMPVAVSESWVWKMEDKEFSIVSPDTFRSRNVFDFWGPVDQYFIQTMEKLADYTQMLYLTSQGNNYFQAYQTYGGTTANGGAANCTCTVTTCSIGDINNGENTLASNNGQIASFTTTGMFYSGLLIAPPDTTAPSAPSALLGTAGYNSASLSWTGSADNVGVAGYNILRCTPTPCTPVWIANAGATTFVDLSLDDNTPYTYQVQAFDISNNTSPVSNTLNLVTALNTPPDSPSNPVATVISPKQINLTWTPPQNCSGLSKYLIYSGTSPDGMALTATLPSASTLFQNQPLNAMTTYYYSVVAVEQGLNSPMSSIASATTLPLPNPPNQLAAAPAAANRITLTWKEAVQPGGLPIANYQVYQGTTPGVYSKIATTTSLTYNSSSLNPATKYYFYVVAVDKSYDASMPSDPVSATTPPLPAAPTGLQSTALSSTKFKLTWQWSQIPGGMPVARYTLYCGTSPTGQPQVGTALTTSYTYTTATAGTQYYCYVVAVDTGNDNSAPSAVLPVKSAPSPNAPNNVVAIANAKSKVTVTWSETLPNGGLSISNYKVYRSNTLPVTMSNYVATRTTCSYIDTTVTTGKTYYYAILANDSGQDASPLSAPASVTTP